MDWVILAGTVGHEVSWTRGLPRPLLPVPESTLLESLLDAFGRSSSGSCTICANGHTDLFTRHVKNNGNWSNKLRFVEDRIPRGAAGCLKACEKQLTGETIVVTGGSVWVEDDPAWMLERHRAEGNTLSVFCTQDTSKARPNAESLLTPSGIYFCEPKVLDFIRPEGYQDLKEQLIPALQKSGLRVGAITLQGKSREVSDWAGYLRVLGEVLSSGRFDTTNYKMLAPGIWIGEDVEIAPRARVVGPALLGPGVKLEDDVVVVGPTILGDECHIGVGSWLVRAVLQNRMRIPAATSMIDQFVPETMARYGHGSVGPHGGHRSHS